MKNLKSIYNDEIKDSLMEMFKYDNIHQIPQLLKVVVHRGLGESTSNSKVVDYTRQQFSDFSGQKPIITRSKKAISNFKLREDQPIGCKVTLRASKMYDFVTKLVNVVLPKIRDFRGISLKGFDGMGNFTLGMKEDILFPEVNYDKADKVRGMDVTFVTSSNTNRESFELLKLLGVPFNKKEFN